MRILTTREAGEQGLMIVWIAVLCAVCMTIAISVSRIGVASRSVTIAQNAADASALSAAYEIARSKSMLACRSAQESAIRNRSKVTRCEFDDNTVIVEVQLVNNGKISATAKAEIE